MRGVLVVALVAACGDSSGAPDATPDGGPITYRLRVLQDLPAALTARIDGVVVNPYETVYDDVAALEGDAFDVELLDGELVLDTWAITPMPDECLDELPDAPIVGVVEELCALPHGELRWASVTVDTAEGSCVADGFCEPRCYPTLEGHCAGAKCGASRLSLDTAWSKLECVPAGAVVVGEACTWTARDDGRHVDDCVRDALCVDGTCVALCDLGEAIPGFPLELQACAPP